MDFGREKVFIKIIKFSLYFAIGFISGCLCIAAAEPLYLY